MPYIFDDDWYLIYNLIFSIFYYQKEPSQLTLARPSLSTSLESIESHRRLQLYEHMIHPGVCRRQINTPLFSHIELPSKIVYPDRSLLSGLNGYCGKYILYIYNFWFTCCCPIVNTQLNAILTFQKHSSTSKVSENIFALYPRKHHMLEHVPLNQFNYISAIIP